MTSPFVWPSDVTAKREFLPGGVCAYYLTHTTIGELGRLVLTPAAGGGAHLSCEVFADGDISQIEERKAVIEPLAKSISARLGGR